MPNGTRGLSFLDILSRNWLQAKSGTRILDGTVGAMRAPLSRAPPCAAYEGDQVANTPLLTQGPNTSRKNLGSSLGKKIEKGVGPTTVAPVKC
jgi:hypothetical protein